MKETIFFWAIVSLSGAFGRIQSPLDKEWHNYRPYQKPLHMVDSHGQAEGTDSHQAQIVNDDPYIRDNVHYYLYTKEHEEPFEITKSDKALLHQSTFSKSRKTKVVIHGYWNNYDSPIDKVLSEAYLSYQDVNIVVVDWSKLCSAPFYNVAAGHTLPVGEEVAQLIDFLVSAGGANVSDVHILGHSLGAHVAAFAANHVTSGRITRISGLDPALPLFGNRPPELRLDPLDADIVDCIHSCGKYLGFYVPLGTHDFYPNGGVPIQPGCGFDWYGSCSHSRSFNLYAASVAGYKFSAQACSSFQDVDRRSCTGEWTGLLGEQAPITAAGLYILQTTGSYPFAE